MLGGGLVSLEVLRSVFFGWFSEGFLKFCRVFVVLFGCFLLLKGLLEIIVCFC